MLWFQRDVCVAACGRGAGGRVSGVPLLRAFAGGSVCDNARTVVVRVPPTPAAAPPATTLHRHTAPQHNHHSDSTDRYFIYYRMVLNYRVFCIDCVPVDR